MTWPIVAELLLTGVISTGSTYLLNAWSPDAVAAVGSLGQVVSFTVNLYTIVSVGGSILLAPMAGAGRYREAGRLIRTLLYANLLFSLAVSVVTLVLIEPFLRMMQLDPALWPIGREYLLVSLGLSVAQSLLITYTAVFRSFGRMKDVLAANFIVFFLCFLVNAAIYFGLPRAQQRIGLYAMAGIIGQSCGALYLHLRLRGFFWKKYGRVRVNREDALRYLRRILRFGVPAGMEGILYLAAQMIVVSMIGSLGTQALLVKAYAGTFAGYMAICTTAVNTAAFVLIGQHLGEGNPEGMRRTYRDGLCAGLMMTTAISAILMAAGRPILHLFTWEEAVIAQVRALLYWQLALELARVPAALSVSGLKAVGEIRLPFLMVIAGGLLNIAVSYGCGVALGWGLPGVWLGYIADMALRAAVEGCKWRQIVRDPAAYQRKVMG